MATETLEDLPHWEDEPDLYDALFLGGEQIVGICTVKISRKVKIDKKSAKGKNKAVVTKQGVEPAEVTISIRVLDRADFQKFQSQMELFEPLTKWKDDSHGDALDIAHWATKMRGIEAIIVESADGPELKDGILEMSIKAVEFHKPKTATGTGGGGGGLRFGFFYDQLGQPIPLSYVAIEGLPAKIDNPGKKDDGKPLLDPQGNQIFVCQQKAILQEIGLTELETTFLGRYVAFDPLIKLKWEEFHPPGEKDKDVTKTPDKSKGGVSVGDFAPSNNDAPDPATTDAAP